MVPMVKRGVFAWLARRAGVAAAGRRFAASAAASLRHVRITEQLSNPTNATGTGPEGVAVHPRRVCCLEPHSHAATNRDR